MRQEFVMHKQLLVHTIQRQAGTLQKAVLEGVMNSADAIEALPPRRRKAARDFGIRITTNSDTGQLILEDTGKGFRSKAEISRYFNTFGTPTEEHETKRFGYFRMGRGQLFSYGKNIWESGNWRMTVDIENWGLAWELNKLDTPVAGCRITVSLYRDFHQLQSLEWLLPVYVKYLDIPVFLNGKQISTPADAAEWQLTTPDAYISLSHESSMRVYNQGVLAANWTSAWLGSGGVICSREPLKLNFARNDIMDDCPVWGRIRKSVKKLIRDRRIKSGKIDLATSEHIVRELRANRMAPDDLRKVKFLADIDNNMWSPNQLARFPGQLLTIGNNDEQSYGTFFIQAKLAWVAHPSFASGTAMTTPAELAEFLRRYFDVHLRAVDWKVLRDRQDWDTIVIDPDDYRIDERIVVAVMERVGASICWRIRTDTNRPDVPYRRIIIGNAANRAAWTDGETYIAISRNVIRKIGVMPAAWPYYIALLVHEYCHHIDDSTAHAHPPEFYQQFHELLTSDLFVDTYRIALTAARNAVVREGKKLPVRKYQDYLAAVQQPEAGAVEEASANA